MKGWLFRAYRWAQPRLRPLGLGLGFQNRFYRFMRRYVDPKRVELDGFHLYLDPEDDILSYNLAQDRPWEPEETELFRSLLREGMDVVDVGAHIGYYSILASGGVGPSGRVFAFEPSPGNFALLTKNLESNGCTNTRALPTAVAETAGSVELHLDPSNTGGHTLVAPRGSGKSVQVESIDLDGWLQREAVRPALVKIDVEGAEWGVLAGLRRTLTESAELTLVMEFFPARIRQGGRDPGEVLELLADCGFDYRIVGSAPEADADAALTEMIQENAPRGCVNLVCRKRGSSGSTR